MERQRITVAVLALGGQGGGVLADWITDLAAQNGFVSQATSVPGVAQRTGSTVYYVEMYPREQATPSDEGPVLALMPVPGDVDVVIASELMETGRAILRGFVTKDRTTLIGSTHRIYAISEKAAMGDGRASGGRILEAARERSKRFIGFDMEAVAASSGSVISSVMFGALAGSEALPFPRTAFEEAIRATGKAVETNLTAFGEGFEGAQGRLLESEAVKAPLIPSSAEGKALAARIVSELPESAWEFATEGVRRLMDYQDERYASKYLDRLADIRAVDKGGSEWRMTRETARHLALWMSYEDTIRVADLKVRASRFERVSSEVSLRKDQLLDITEYMHPRFEEVCETLPASVGAWLLSSKRFARISSPLFKKGRHVRTSSAGWFMLLYALASMRRWRRGTLRYELEQARIQDWLALIRSAALEDQDAAIELVQCQRLIKGYSDTFARGLANFAHIVAVYERIRSQPEAAAVVRQLRGAALQDDEGKALRTRTEELALAI